MFGFVLKFVTIVIAFLSGIGLLVGVPKTLDVGKLYVDVEIPRPSQEFGLQYSGGRLDKLELPFEFKTNGYPWVEVTRPTEMGDVLVLSQSTSSYGKIAISEPGSLKLDLFPNK